MSKAYPELENLPKEFLPADLFADLARGECMEELLRELVQLKRAKDGGGIAQADYERRKTIAWRHAFRVFGYYEEPKP